MRDAGEQFAKRFIKRDGDSLSVAGVLRVRQFELYSVLAFAVEGTRGKRFGAAAYDLEGRLVDGGYLSGSRETGSAWGGWSSSDSFTVLVARDLSGNASVLRLDDAAGHRLEDVPIASVSILRYSADDLEPTSAVATWLDRAGSVIDSFQPLAGRRPQPTSQHEGH